MSMFGNLDHESQRSFQFEEHVVKTLLKHYSIPSLKYELLRECEELTGHKRLTLAQFVAHFPSFPAVLHPATPSHLDKDCTVRRLMQNMQGTKLWEAWERATEFYPRKRGSKPLAVLVRWPRSDYTLAFHDSYVPDRPGPSFLFQKGRKLFVMEPFVRYLHGLNWGPGADD